MLPTPCYLLSDTHLGVGPLAIEAQLRSFLRAVPGRAKSLVLNGDIFDFWYEWRTVMPRTGFRVIAALADLREAGVEIVWLSGNHDVWGSALLRNDVGLDFRLDDWQGAIGGWHAHIEHGDGLRDVEDRTYRRVQHVMRSRWAIHLFGMLHPNLANWIAVKTSSTSRQLNRQSDGAGLERVAMARLAAHPEVNLVVFGHAHVSTLKRAPGGGVYANPGTWLDAPNFLRITDETVELRRWTGSGEGDRLDALDRLPQKPLGRP